jgi:SAM-dependent methyltransferase
MLQPVTIPCEMPMTTSPPAQTWHAGRYASNARFVAELGLPVVALLDPRPGERILDLGCGDGALTERLAGLGCSVVGVDSAPEMVAATRARGLDAQVVDGEALTFEAAFDAVFSNAALHWMRRPDAVIAGVRRALVPGGRFVGEFGGHGNVAAITVALVAVLERRGLDGAAAIPWYFPTPEDWRRRLEAQGFTVESLELIPRPTPLPTDMAGWLDTFAGAFLGRLPAPQRATARDEVLDLLRPCLCDDRGRWTADYVRLRFAARLPGPSATAYGA